MGSEKGSQPRLIIGGVRQGRKQFAERRAQECYVKMAPRKAAYEVSIMEGVVEREVER